MRLENYYTNERRAYEVLNGITYKSGDGKWVPVVPKCYEIGKNYIIIEKYECSMMDMFNMRMIVDELEGEMNKMITTYVEPMMLRLNEMKVAHYDIAYRNIVYNKDLKKVSIIDFGMSEIGKEGYYGNITDTTFFMLTGSIDMCHMYCSTKEIEFYIIHNNTSICGLEHVSEHDKVLLRSTNFKEITREHLRELKFDDKYTKENELNKLWYAIHK